jgi:hypothetical protein
MALDGVSPVFDFDAATPRGDEDQLPYRVGKAEQSLTRPAGHRLDASTREGHAEEIQHQRLQAIQRHERKGQEIENDRGDPIALLHRRAHRCRKGGLGHRTPSVTKAAMGTVLGQNKRLRL